MKRFNLTFALSMLITFFVNAQTAKVEVVSPVILFTVDTFHHTQVSCNAFLFRDAGIYKLCTSRSNVTNIPVGFTPCQFYYLAIKDYTIPKTIPLTDTSKYYRSGTLYVDWNYWEKNGHSPSIAIGTILNQQAIKDKPQAFGYITNNLTQDTSGAIISVRMSGSNEITFQRFLVKKCDFQGKEQNTTFYGLPYEVYKNEYGGGGIILSAKYKEFLGIVSSTLKEELYTTQMKAKYKTILVSPNSNVFFDLLAGKSTVSK